MQMIFAYFPFHLLDVKLAILSFSPAILANFTSSFCPERSHLISWCFYLADCENLLKKFLVLNPEKRAPLEVLLRLFTFSFNIYRISSLKPRGRMYLLWSWKGAY